MSSFRQFYRRLLSATIDSRIWSLLVKEFFQIIRNKELIVLLIVPATVQLFIFGFALSPEVKNINLGIADYANSNDSRELISAFTENDVFVKDAYGLSQQNIAKKVQTGSVKVGLVIPPDFDRNITEKSTANIQILLDGVDAYTAGIAQGYAKQILESYNRTLVPNPPEPLLETRTWFLYNPGLKSSWFFVPGVMGVILTLASSVTTAIATVQEKERGTLEQLLMTPALTWEIITAKVVPLFLLLIGDIFLALGVGNFVFRMPFQGNFILFLILSALYILVGMSIGMLMATLSGNKQQAILTSFFLTIPIIQTAGAIAPLESMPIFVQRLSWINPLRHYIEIVRSIVLKGVGLEAIWYNAIALFLFATILFGISIYKFRTQLS